jgi:hypothetical protein
MKSSISMELPASYVIRICGKLDERWLAYYDNMVLEVEDRGTQRPITTLTGQVPDQAALIGMLTLLYDMRCPLISVECLC